jgi:hypothetical protein
MQENFPAIAMERRYAGNAGAIPAPNVYHQTALPVQRFRSNVRPD